VIRRLFLSSLLAAALSPIALADSECRVVYIQRFEANNPDSPVAMQIEIELQEVDMTAGYTRWLPISVSVQQFDETGALVSTWTDNSPTVESQDGMWSIAHASDTPKVNEFDASPTILGVGFFPDETPVGYRLEVSPDPSVAMVTPPSARLRIRRTVGTTTPPPPPPPPPADDDLLIWPEIVLYQ
jgi:hypothetical protein